MTRKELTKILYNLCKEKLTYSDKGFMFYSEKRSYWSRNFFPKQKQLNFNTKYYISNISWTPEACHGISISLINKDPNTKFTPEFSKTLFWVTNNSNCRITNEEILILIHLLNNY